MCIQVYLRVLFRLPLDKFFRHSTEDLFSSCHPPIGCVVEEIPKGRARNLKI